jgi:hypothetical protein
MVLFMFLKAAGLFWGEVLKCNNNIVGGILERGIRVVLTENLTNTIKSSKFNKTSLI